MCVLLVAQDASAMCDLLSIRAEVIKSGKRKHQTGRHQSGNRKLVDKAGINQASANIKQAGLNQASASLVDKAGIIDDQASASHQTSGTQATG